MTIRSLNARLDDLKLPDAPAISAELEAVLRALILEEKYRLRHSLRRAQEHGWKSIKDFDADARREAMALMSSTSRPEEGNEKMRSVMRVAAARGISIGLDRP